MKKLEKGFTLIELMIVVAIIGILAAVAAPRFGNQIQRARDAKGLAVISTWRSATNLYYSDKLEHAEKIGNLLKNVDTGTVNATFDVNTDDTPVTSGSGIVYVLVGKGEETTETNDKHGVRFQVGTGDKEGEIQILTTETNSSDVEWNTL